MASTRRTLDLDSISVCEPLSLKFVRGRDYSTPWSERTTVFDNIHDTVQFLQQPDGNWNELIPGDKLSRPYLDFEITNLDGSNEEIDRIIFGRVKNLAIDAFKSFLPADVSEDVFETRELTCHRNVPDGPKFSKHCVFPRLSITPYDMKYAILSKMYELYVTAHPNAAIENSKGSQIPGLDTSVYGSQRLLRAPLQQIRPASERPASITSRYIPWEFSDFVPMRPESEHPLEDFLVTYLDGNEIEIRIPEKDKRKIISDLEDSELAEKGDSWLSNEEVRQVISHIPERFADKYDTWVAGGFALADHVSKSGGKKAQFYDYFHEFSKLSPKYKEAETEKKARNVWENKANDQYRSKFPTTTFGSIVYWVKTSVEGEKFWDQLCDHKAKQLMERLAKESAEEGYLFRDEDPPAASEECLFRDDDPPAASEQPVEETREEIMRRIEFNRWARATPGVDQVIDMFKSVNGNLEGFAYDGDKVYKIDDVSGRYIMYEDDDMWKKAIGGCVKAVVLPLWKGYSKLVWCTPPQEYTSIDKNGEPKPKLLPWRKDLDRTLKLINDSTGFMARVAQAYRNEIYDKVMATEQGLDTRCHLIGCENGVIDLEQRDELGRFVLRKARADEYVSKSTGFDYSHVEFDDPRYVGCSNVLRDFWVKRHSIGDKKGLYGALMSEEEDPLGYETLRCAMMLVCSNMRGGNNIQSLIMFVGQGANGKSVLVNLIRAAMGGYCVVVPGSFWEVSRKSSEGAAPFMMSIRGTRYVVSLEISSSPLSVLDTEKMKNITGGDELRARFLFGNKVHGFYVDALPIWNVNHTPENWSEKSGYAVLRRPKGIDFPFRYSCEECDIDIAKIADEQLESRNYRRSIGLPMFQIMLDFHKMYLDNDPFVKKPMSKQMEVVTSDIKGAIDEHALFVRNKLAPVSDDRFFVPVKFLLELFKDQTGNAKVVEKVFGKAIASEIREMTGLSKGKADKIRLEYAGEKMQVHAWSNLILRDADDAKRLAEKLGLSDRRAALVAAYNARNDMEGGDLKYAEVGKVPDINASGSGSGPIGGVYGFRD